MVNLGAYWSAYDATLARVRSETPNTFEALKGILDSFEPPSSGDAFFPGGSDDDLADALIDAGWVLNFREGAFVYTAHHPDTGARLEHVEGDLYDRSPMRPAMTAPGARIALIATADPHTRLLPGATGTVDQTDGAGTVHVLWDDGTRLGLIPGEDRWQPLHPRWDTQRMTSRDAEETDR